MRRRDQLVLAAAGEEEEELFQQYVELREERPGDPESTIMARLSLLSGVPADRLEDMSRARDWHGRFTELKMIEAVRFVEAAQATLPIRHLQMALEMQQKALAALDQLDVRTVEEARRLIQTGVDIERTTLGRPTRIMEVQDRQALLKRVQWLMERFREYNVLEEDTLDIEKTS